MPETTPPDAPAVRIRIGGYHEIDEADDDQWATHFVAADAWAAFVAAQDAFTNAIRAVEAAATAIPEDE